MILLQRTQKCVLTLYFEARKVLLVCVFLISRTRLFLNITSITRRLAACTQAVVILRSTSYIATELNVLHLKSYEIQSNRYMCAIVPLIAFLEIDL